MPLGLSKPFIIFFVISVGLGYATKNWRVGLVLMGMFAVITILWRYLTG